MVMAVTRAMRQALIAEMRRHTGVGDAIAEAFLTVPRHVFLPETPVEQVYRDEAIVTKRGADGMPTSSSSQPTIMAAMLGQLAVRPGDRVLEIGAGTGFNAALLAALTGPDGEVVSVDIDPDLVATARSNLEDAGYSGVTVVASDGAEGFAEGAPYDRIIATVGAWDLAPAWLDQLAPGGRIVVPLDLYGVQRSVALERAHRQTSGRWRSVSVLSCGFMRMRGPLAGPERYEVLDPDSGLTIFLPDGRDADGVLGALEGRVTAQAVTTGLPVDPAVLFDGFSLWLAVHEPRWCTLSEAAGTRLPPSPLTVQGVSVTAGIRDGGGIALLTAEKTGRDAGWGVGYPSQVEEVVARGYGPDGARLAGELAAHARTWLAAGRPMTDTLHIDAYPACMSVSTAPTTPLLEKRHTTLAITWPAG
ncbi:methyltransferase, FxLD system [Spongiactinospora rosea]|uniref:Protein-L-isoaspartate O-methyltransferase n=2 Tax=Spongiactinospora rosea TaxID=2248750 RepID=A0A366LWN2_9ACTN|nr:methyltransferase, FxLD system [Spongiactinospora rosea]